MNSSRYNYRLIHLPVPSPSDDRGATRSVNFRNFFTVYLFRLQRSTRSQLYLISILNDRSFFRLVVRVMFLTSIRRTPSSLMVMSTLRQVIMSIVFFVNTLGYLRIRRFGSIFLRIGLLLSFRCYRYHFRVRLGFVGLVLSFTSRRIYVYRP